MRFRYVVEVDVERESGKFASREDVDAELTDALENADPGDVSGVGADSDSTYNVVEWTVTEDVS